MLVLHVIISYDEFNCPSQEGTYFMKIYNDRSMKFDLQQLVWLKKWFLFSHSLSRQMFRFKPNIINNSK